MSKRVFVCVCVREREREREKERERESWGKTEPGTLADKADILKQKGSKLNFHNFTFFTVMLNIVMLCPEACRIKLFMAVIVDIS